MSPPFLLFSSITCKNQFNGKIFKNRNIRKIPPLPYITIIMIFSLNFHPLEVESAFFTIITEQNSILDSIAYPLIVPVSLSENPFKPHPAFFHYFTGIWILRIMPCSNSSKSTFCKQIMNDRLQDFCHNPLVPPRPANTVSHFHGCQVIIL